jgi:hypothetical protein
MEKEQLTPAFTAETLSRDDRSILLYCECRLVDAGGLLSGTQVNATDLSALNDFKDAGILDYGRIPFHVMESLPAFGGQRNTYWVTFNDAAWKLAHDLRKLRAAAPHTSRQKVDAALLERNAIPF